MPGMSSSPTFLFQSSPGPKARCNAYLQTHSPLRRVSILTGPEGPVQRADGRGHPPALHVSILTGPEGPVQPDLIQPALDRFPVSILTGPEGPVQQGLGGGNWRRANVSILTGPEGPVQLSHLCLCYLLCARFNPHRARRPGATSKGAHPSCDPWRFQSSPGPKARCNGAFGDLRRAPDGVSILTGPEGPVQPARSAGGLP